MKRRFMFAGLVVLAVGYGCAGKDTVEPPAELVDLDNQISLRRLWSNNVGGGGEALLLGLTPATDGARIFAGAHNGKAAAFEAETGRRIWQSDTKLPLAAGPGYGADILVFGTNDGELVALDANTGEQRWLIDVGGEVLAPPVVSPNVVVFRSVDGRLRGVATRDGTELWTAEQPPPTLSLRGTTAPKIMGTTAVSGFDNGRVAAYALGTGQALWDVPIANATGSNDLERLVDISTTVQVVGNDVYAASYQGRVVGIDINTGLVLWQQDMSSFAGLGTDANNVYVTDDFGAVVAMSRRGGAAVWRQEALRLRDVTAPVRFGDSIVVGDFDGYLHWMSPIDGTFVARTRAARSRISAVPLVVGVNLFVQADDGTVAAFAVEDDSA